MVTKIFVNKVPISCGNCTFCNSDCNECRLTGIKVKEQMQCPLTDIYHELNSIAKEKYK